MNSNTGHLPITYTQRYMNNPNNLTIQNHRISSISTPSIQPAQVRSVQRTSIPANFVHTQSLQFPIQQTQRIQQTIRPNNMTPHAYHIPKYRSSLIPNIISTFQRPHCLSNTYYTSNSQSSSILSSNFSFQQPKSSSKISISPPVIIQNITTPIQLSNSSPSTVIPSITAPIQHTNYNSSGNVIFPSNNAPSYQMFPITKTQSTLSITVENSVNAHPNSQSRTAFNAEIDMDMDNDDMDMRNDNEHPSIPPPPSATMPILPSIPKENQKTTHSVDKKIQKPISQRITPLSLSSIADNKLNNSKSDASKKSHSYELLQQLNKKQNEEIDRDLLVNLAKNLYKFEPKEQKKLIKMFFTKKMSPKKVTALVIAPSTRGKKTH